MKKFVIIFFSATSLICCQNKEKNTTVENINNDIDFIIENRLLRAVFLLVWADLYFFIMNIQQKK